MRSARSLAIVGGALCLALALGGPARSEEKDPKSRPVADHERDEAIRKGLRYLDAQVFRLPDASGTPRKQFTVAVHGIVRLLADDEGTRTDGRGGQLQRARAFLERYVDEVRARTKDEAQLPRGPGAFDTRYVMQYTWPLAMGALFFGELHARGMRKAEAARTLGRIRELLLAAQDAGGGWGHHRVAANGGDARGTPGGGYAQTLVSASYVVAASLGLVHPEDADAAPLARAVDYFRNSRLEGGNQPYDPSQRSAYTDMTGVSRAAGACFAMWAMGVPWRDPDMKASLEWVDDNFDYLNEGHGSSTLNLLYGALLQKARGPKAWKRFKERWFRAIVDGQDAEGAFACICEGKAFAATNDSEPLAGRGKGVVKQAGDPGLLRGLMGDGTGCYVTALHTLILLLDRAPPRLFGGDRPRLPKDAAPPAVTPR